MGTTHHKDRSNPRNFCLNLLSFSRCYSISKPDSPVFSSQKSLYSSSFHYKDPIYLKKTEKTEEFEEKLINLLKNSVKTDEFLKKTLKIAIRAALTPKEIQLLADFLMKTSKILSFLRLDFSGNSLKTAEILIFAEILSSFSHLEGFELLLPHSELSYISGKTLVKSLEFLENLRYFSIDLSDNSEISISALEGLAEKIGFFLKLESLHLRLEKVRLSSSDLFFIELLRSLEKCQYLTVLKLDLSENSLQPNLLNYFLNGLSKVAGQLTELHLVLNQNSLKIEDFAEISRILREKRSLKTTTFSFKNCGVKVAEFELLLVILGKMKTIETLSLDFSENDLKTTDFRLLVDFMNPESCFESIVKFALNVENSSLDETFYENIALLLHCMRNMKEIQLLFENVPSNKGFEQILCAFANFTRLFSAEIGLRRSGISLENADILIKGFSHLKLLRRLEVDLCGNLAFGLKETKGFCGEVARIVGLLEVKIRIKGKSQRRCADLLEKFVDRRRVLVEMGRKFKALGTGARKRIFLYYLHRNPLILSESCVFFKK